MRKKNPNVKINGKINAETVSRQISTGLPVKYFIGIVSFLLVVLLLQGEKTQARRIPEAGEIANNDMQAFVDFNYTDDKATGYYTEQAAAKVQDMYYIDNKIKIETIGEINKLFDMILAKSDFALVEKDITWLDNLSIKVFMQASNTEQIRENLIKLSSDLYDKGIINSMIKIRVLSKGGETVNIIDHDTNIVREANIGKLIIVDEIDQTLDARLRLMHPLDRLLRQAEKSALVSQLKQNIFYDSKEVDLQRDKARQEVVPVSKNIKEGQIIIRRGDPITELQRSMLIAEAKEIERLKPKTNQLLNISGNILLVTIFFIILIVYLHFHQPEIFSSNKHLFLLSTIIIISLGLSRIISNIPLNTEKPLWEYFILIPVGAMLIAILMDKELAILCSALLSILSAYIAGRHVPYIIMMLFSSIIAIQAASGIIHRWKFIMTGVIIGAANALAIIMINMANIYLPNFVNWNKIFYQILGGFISGILCAVILDILMPILEKIFDITTNIRLLELSDLNHPLLKQMITEAPGTYHHSILVSNMAEEAASAIGANGLLAKIGGYFHDIGKVTKSEYFVENTWFEKESRHEKLLPTMSNIVITAHVKDGINLARKYKLPKAVVDIIEEHHGTSVVYYFYKKAEKSQNVQNIGEIVEEDFRYPGPKPGTKESGIILLADAIEAASHALVKPNPAKIEDLVNEISQEKINDGQLDECDLTLKDISIIKRRFTHILTGILHKRIDYPDKNENKNQ